MRSLQDFEDRDVARSPRGLLALDEVHGRDGRALEGGSGIADQHGIQIDLPQRPSDLDQPGLRVHGCQYNAGRVRAARAPLCRSSRRLEPLRRPPRAWATGVRYPSQARTVLDSRTQAVLDEVVRRIVEVAAPERIVLFGSAVRGDFRADSDIDLLVIKSGVAHRRRLAQEIDRHLFGIAVPIDVIVVTPEDVRAAQGRVGSVIEPALREGREIYAA